MGNDSSLMRRRAQRGQAAMEFIFAMLILMGIIAVLFQVLHFELDVFNKTMMTRYKLLETARENEDTTRPRMISEEIEGKQLGDLIPWEVPFQSSSVSHLKYGPKSVYWQCGTKYFFPGGDVAEVAYKVAVAGLLTADHYEDTAGHVETVFSGLGSATGTLAGFCP